MAPEIDRGVVDSALQRMRDNVPAFRDLVVRETWGGVLTCTPDTLPVVGPLDQIPGLVAAAGFSEGLTAIGLAVSELVRGAHVGSDLHPFRYGRFS